MSLLHKAKVSVLHGATVENAQGDIGDGQIILPGKSVSIKLDSFELERNLLYIGAIGSGKTTGIFHAVGEIRKMMTENDVMVIFDTKGDYLSRFHRKGDKVITNRQDSEHDQSIWNLFNEIHETENELEIINEISRTLYDPYVEGSRDIFFPNAARDLTTSVLSAIKRMRNSSTNSDIRHWLYDSKASDIRNLLGNCDDLRGALQYIEFDSPQTMGVMSNIRIMIQDLFSGVFGKAGSFSVRNFISKKGGKALFIEYDIATGKTLLPIYRVIIDLAIKESLSRTRSEGNVYFVFDEFALLPNLYHIDNGINFGRSLGAKFVCGIQNVGQILEAYGEGRGYSILSGFGTVFAFRLNDNKSMDFVSERYGTNQTILRLQSVTPGSHVETIVSGKVIEDWNLCSLPTGHAIVSLPRQKNPFLFQFERHS